MATENSAKLSREARRMKLVVLSSLSPYAVYLIQQVQQHWPIRRIIRPTSGRRPLTKRRWSKFCKAPLSALVRASRRRVYAWHAKRLHKQISRFLVGSHQWPSGSRTLMFFFPARIVNLSHRPEPIKAIQQELMRFLCRHF